MCREPECSLGQLGRDLWITFSLEEVAALVDVWVVWSAQEMEVEDVSGVYRYPKSSIEYRDLSIQNTRSVVYKFTSGMDKMLRTMQTVTYLSQPYSQPTASTSLTWQFSNFVYLSLLSGPALKYPSLVYSYTSGRSLLSYLLPNPLDSYITIIQCTLPSNFIKNHYSCVLFDNYGDNILILGIVMIMGATVCAGIGFTVYCGRKRQINNIQKQSSALREDGGSLANLNMNASVANLLSSQSPIVSRSPKSIINTINPRPIKRVRFKFLLGQRNSNCSQESPKVGPVVVPQDVATQNKQPESSKELSKPIEPPQQKDQHLLSDPLSKRSFVQYLNDNLGIKFFMIQLMAGLTECCCYSFASVFSIPITEQMTLSNWVAIIFISYYLFTLIGLLNIINNLRRRLEKEKIENKDGKYSFYVLREYIVDDSYTSKLKYFDFYFEDMKVPDRPWKFYLPVVVLIHDLLIAFSIFILGNYWILQNVSVLLMEGICLLFDVKADMGISKWNRRRSHSIKGLYIMYIILNIICNIAIDPILLQSYLGLTMLIILLILITIDAFTTLGALFYGITTLYKLFCKRKSKQDTESELMVRTTRTQVVQPAQPTQPVVVALPSPSKLAIFKPILKPSRVGPSSPGGFLSAMRAIKTNRLNAEEDSNRNSPITSFPRNLPLQNLAKSQDTLNLLVPIPVFPNDPPESSSARLFLL